MDALRLKVVKAGAGQLFRGRCMYLSNHRCWYGLAPSRCILHACCLHLSHYFVLCFCRADFFVDTLIIEGRGMPLSRCARLLTRSSAVQPKQLPLSRTAAQLILHA